MTLENDKAPASGWRFFMSARRVLPPGVDSGLN
jgi:hypothetical protein